MSKSVATFEGVLGAIKSAFYCGLGTLFVLFLVQVQAAWLPVAAIRVLAVIGAMVGAGIGYAFASARAMSDRSLTPRIATGRRSVDLLTLMDAQNDQSSKYPPRRGLVQSTPYPANMPGRA